MFMFTCVSKPENTDGWMVLCEAKLVCELDLR